MKPQARVKLHWLVKTDLNHPPVGQNFTLPVCFDHQGDDWVNDAWSLVFQLEGSPDVHGNQIGIVRFLMPSGPNGWLQQGKKFTIFSGRNPIADAEVVKRID